MAFGVVKFEKDFKKWKAQHNKHRSAPFASTIFIEVYSDQQTNEKFLRYVYNGIP